MKIMKINIKYINTFKFNDNSKGEIEKEENELKIYYKAEYNFSYNKRKGYMIVHNSQDLQKLNKTKCIESVFT